MSPSCRLPFFCTKSYLAVTLCGVACLWSATAAAEPLCGADTMLVFNGFRSPSIGLEYRCDGMGLHAGLYPTVISKGLDGAYETSWFGKVGATAYPLPVVLYGKRPSSLFFSLSYAYGFDNRWRHSLLADAGIRWAAVAGLEMRLGAALLISPTGPPRINPTPGINYAVAF